MCKVILGLEYDCPRRVLQFNLHPKVMDTDSVRTAVTQFPWNRPGESKTAMPNPSCKKIRTKILRT
jgi:hypothetical protein